MTRIEPGDDMAREAIERLRGWDFRMDADKVEPLRDQGNIPRWWIRPQPAPSGEAGLHRFVWDLHYPPPPAERSYPIAAVYRDTPAEPRGPNRRIGLRLGLTGRYDALVNLLARLETARPPLVVDNLQLHGPLARPGMETVATLDAGLDVYGFRSSDNTDSGGHE